MILEVDGCSGEHERSGIINRSEGQSDNEFLDTLVLFVMYTRHAVNFDFRSVYGKTTVSSAVDRQFTMQDKDDILRKEVATPHQASITEEIEY